MNVNKNFIGSKMNKSLDERLIPNGDYIDALNIRVSSDENGQAGSAENTKGTTKLTDISNYVSEDAVCIGALEDGTNETIYWFVASDTADVIASYDTKSEVTRYHIIDTNGILNFDKKHLINGVNLIDNLLFFTDNYNPPRRINVDRAYNDFTAEDLLVIVKPPKSSPKIKLSKTNNESNYISDKFIRFAYRYRYSDGEYSALSEFSKIAFAPSPFAIDYSTYDMLGMRNSANTVSVSFNTGNKNVVSIDLCFKDSKSNIINVIERFKKKDQGWNDNQNVSIEFDNKKVYTTLLESEILRLYDNVPRFAKTQTFLGNRLMYGNYVDGYDIDTTIDYSLSLNSEDISLKSLPISYNDGTTYTLGTPITVASSEISIDLTGIDLKEGASISIDFNLIHSSFNGDASYDNDTAFENKYESTFTFVLSRDYVSVTDLATSLEFLESIQSTEYYSLNTLFYESILVNGDGLWTKNSMGITSPNGGFLVTNTSTSINIQVPAIRYELISSPGTYAYEYLYNSSTFTSYLGIADTSSLHSNRDYEVAIVYMDDFSRASTALVCKNNTINVPSSLSDQKNTISVTVKNKAPEWATRYRFVIKPDKEKYETIYTNIYFQDKKNGYWWIKLEGDNISKVKEGDKLLVKADSNGVTNSLIETKVLKISTNQEDFISENTTDLGVPIIEPSGVYMSLRPSNFSIEYQDNSYISYGEISAKTKRKSFASIALGFLIGNIIAPGIGTIFTYVNILKGQSGPAPYLAYPTHQSIDNNGVIEYKQYDIPAGSSVRIYFQEVRSGRGSRCGSRKYLFDKRFTATRDYNNMYDFIIGENIDFNEPTNNPDADSSDDTPTVRFIKQIGTSLDLGYENAVLKIQYVYLNGDPEQAYLLFQGGTRRCNNHDGRIYVNIEVSRSSDFLIFETEPLDANSITYYESSESYDIVDGYHNGNVQNQTISQDAIIDLDFFNCYSFGNGAESYKINDGLADPGFYMGERVTAVSEEDYKEAHRYADITYSGVYNEESNVNKLNEFNLGLVNYKPLEKTFGPIQKIHARQTDILVLQEDKISYVLSGKNLLSDAAAGGAIYSSPEVLGTQIARIEENGISHNPESFATYGFDIFFTDAKRNAVLNLKGSGYKNDQLSVISNTGMKSWFRDLFTNDLNTFKIGGYDPYHNEYILSSTSASVEQDIQTIGCGSEISQVNSSNSVTYNVSLNEGTGIVYLPYNFVSGEASIVVTYNGVDVIDTVINGTGTVSFNKSLLSVNEYTISITPTNATYSIETGCVDVGDAVTIFRIVSNDATISGDTTHHNYSWSGGDIVSPTFTDFITFTDGPTSLFESSTGVEGVGGIPVDGSTVTMRAIKETGDIVDFSNGKFKYLQSNVLYTDISVLLPLMNEATPILNPFEGSYNASFTYNTGYAYTYIVWDYKIGNLISLCYSDVDAVDVCCNCI